MFCIVHTQVLSDTPRRRLARQCALTFAWFIFCLLLYQFSNVTYIISLILSLFSCHVYHWFLRLWDFSTWGKPGHFDFWKGIARGGNSEKSNAVFYSMFSAHFQDFFLWKYNIIIISCLSAKRTLIMLFNPLFSKVMH